MYRRLSWSRHLFLEQLHHRRRQYVHAEKAKIMARPEPGHDQPLLRLRRRWLFQHLRYFVKPFPPGNEPPADRPIMRQLALMRRLHGRHRAILSARDLDQLLRGSLLAPAHIQVVAYQQQKRVAIGELASAIDGMPITQRLLLLDEVQPPAPI